MNRERLAAWIAAIPDLTGYCPRCPHPRHDGGVCDFCDCGAES
jgi:hypothetical protein